MTRKEVCALFEKMELELYLKKSVHHNVVEHVEYPVLETLG